MAISKYYVHTRPNTSVEFFSNTSSVLQSQMELLSQACVASGNLVYTSDISADGLTQTKSRTFSNIEDFNAVNNLTRPFSLTKEIMLYNKANGLSTLPNIAGIEQSFTVTSSYNISNFSGNIESISLDIKNLARVNLVNISVGTDTITTVHSFSGCDDYNRGLSIAKIEGFLSNVDCTVNSTTTVALV